MNAKTKQTAKRSAGTASRAELVEAMRHPLRAEILMLLTERVASASGLESELAERHDGVSYETIAYHFRKLQELNCIELVREDPSKGAPEKFFRATVRAVFDTSDMEELSSFAAESKLVTYAEALIKDLARSVEAGHFRDDGDTTVLRTFHLLDREAFHELSEMMLDFNERLIELGAESAARRSHTGEEPLPVETGLLGFRRVTDDPAS